MSEFSISIIDILITTTDPVAVITDLYDGLILSQVPHHCFPTGGGRSQDVLNLPVPRHNADVFSRLKHRKQSATLNYGSLTIILRKTSTGRQIQKNNVI